MTPAGSRRPELEIASSAPPIAWITLAAVHLFWLIGANGWFSLTHAIQHSAAHADLASGRTYFINSHGAHFWIRPQQFQFYDQSTNFSLVGLFVSVIFMILVFKGPTIRYMLRKRVFYIAPIVLVFLSFRFWHQA